MMDELVAFLRARLDERGQAARAATPGPWEADTSGHQAQLLAAQPPSTFRAEVWHGSGPEWFDITGADWLSDVDATHIALNDPAYVLADVESKRKVIEMYEGAVAALPKVGGDLDAEAILRATIATCEATVRLLAAVFDGHPDYDESWRP